MFWKMVTKAEIFRQTELFRELDDDACRALATHSTERRLERNEILFLAGEEAQGLYVIARGSLRAFRTGYDGREQVIHVEHAVTTIAEVPVFDNGKYPSTVAAEEPSVVYFLERKEIQRLCLQHPQIALAAAGLLAKRLRRCAELVETLSLREVGQRLGRLILEQAKSSALNSRDGVRIRQDLTHNQLAARIGTVREVVSRALNRLQEQGLIKIDGKEVMVPDLKRLSEYSDMN
jgi:CRP/FNR family transcriptional regulator